jgi:glycosyltransferase involved in cell wall biosynthesis
VKNIPRLVEVIKRVLEARSDAHVVVIGEGLDAQAASVQMQRNPHLHFVGPRSDIASVMRDSTVLLLTSDSEGMPNVVMEALASGLPVVSTNVGDVATLVPEDCGAVVPAAVEDLTAAVLRVLDDADRYRTAAGKYAGQFVASYSTAAMAQRTVEAWYKAASRAVPVESNQ